MNAPLLPDALRLLERSEKKPPRALRYVWHGRFGSMLIEVVDGAAFVNGQRVEPIAPAGPGAR
jgi:hypothetical protein